MEPFCGKADQEITMSSADTAVSEVAAQRSHLRSLVSEPLISDLTEIVQRIAGERGLWLDAIRSIGDWLYFDRRGVPDPLPEQVRSLYDALLPTDPVERALLYTRF
ncbi:MAG: hypothetical protein J0I57_22200 [Hyphomicrobium sp.]|nr:hypothetical protein [Hyphomicrobium sp.]